MTTAIPYARESWSVVTGCSFGCKWCWSRAIAHRFGRSFKPTFHADKLAEPLHWKKPRTVVVAFNGDLFGPEIDDEQIAAVFGVMAACPQHRFLVLTKRAGEMRDWFKWVSPNEWETINDATDEGLTRAGLGIADRAIAMRQSTSRAEWKWPLPNVWIGASVTNQKDADDRIPDLLACPAAVHWVSYEPAIGPVDFFGPRDCDPSRRWLDTLDWIVAGAQSGPGALPAPMDAILDVCHDCEREGVPFMWKNPIGFPPLDGVVHDAMPGACK